MKEHTDDMKKYEGWLLTAYNRKSIENPDLPTFVTEIEDNIWVLYKDDMWCISHITSVTEYAEASAKIYHMFDKEVIPCVGRSEGVYE